MSTAPYPKDLLGFRYRDTISGFIGTATEVCYFDDWSITVKLEAVMDEGVRRIEWFTLPRLEQEATGEAEAGQYL